METVTSPTAITPYYQFTSSAQPTPLSSATATPTNTSPTSPTQTQQLLFTRQLRPPKAPLYVPAVLRPTERPLRYSRSKTGSQDSVSRTTSLMTPPSTPGTSFDSKDGALMEEGMKRRVMVDGMYTAGISRVVTDEWSEEALEDVTGAPTRDHWKPNTSTPHCTLPACQSPFTLLRRRHHCRRCGSIFCSSHTPHSVPLDQHARFHPLGSPARACDCCWADFAAWKRGRRGRDGSASGSEAGSQGSEGGSGSVTPIAVEERGEGKARLVVGSVPRDWNWSTF